MSSSPTQADATKAVALANAMRAHLIKALSAPMETSLGPVEPFTPELVDLLFERQRPVVEETFRQFLAFRRTRLPPGTRIVAGEFDESRCVLEESEFTVREDRRNRPGGLIEVTAGVTTGDEPYRRTQVAAPNWVVPPEKTAARKRKETIAANDSQVAASGAPDAVLVGCVAGKHAGHHEAKDLYIGDLWNKRRAYAEASGRPWAILSARYHLVMPSQIIESYDEKFPTRAAAAERWGDITARELLSWLRELKCGRDTATVEVHAGKAYVEALRRGLKAINAPVKLLTPLAGMGIGQQKGWYKRALAPAAPEAEAQTPGTQVKWSTLAEWTDAYHDLEARRARAGEAGKRRAHLAELTVRPDVIGAATVPQLQSALALAKGTQPPRGSRADHPSTPLIDLLQAELARRSGGTDKSDSRLEATDKSVSAPAATDTFVADAGVATPEEIPLRIAQAAFTHTSQDPQRAARINREDYATTFNRARTGLLKLAQTPEQRAVVEEELPTLRQRFRAAWIAWLHAHSSTSSVLVTGPAGRNLKRERKRSTAADNRYKAAIELLETGVTRISRKVKATRLEERGGVIGDLRLRLKEREEAQDRMKAVNRILRGKGSPEAIADRLVRELKMAPALAREAVKPDFMGREGYTYELKNNNSEIRRLRQRLEDEEAKAAAGDARRPEELEFPFSTGSHAYPWPGSVEYDYDDDRLRLRFDVRIPRDAFKAVRSRGFVWSRKNEAFQRKLTDGAVAAARAITGLNLPMVAARSANPSRPRRLRRRANRSVAAATNTLFGTVELFADRPGEWRMDILRPTGERVLLVDVDKRGRRTFYDPSTATPAPEAELVYELAPASAYYVEAQTRDFASLLRSDGHPVPDELVRVLADVPRRKLRRDLKLELEETQRAIAKGDRSEALYAKHAYLSDALSARRRNPPVDARHWRAAQNAAIADAGGRWSVPVCYAALNRYEEAAGPVPDRSAWVAANWRRLQPARMVV